jgi:hypothetical protein
MTEFERGVRWVMQNNRVFALGISDNPDLQFGDHVLVMSPRGPAFNEREIKAVLILGGEDNV